MTFDVQLHRSFPLRPDATVGVDGQRTWRRTRHVLTALLLLFFFAASAVASADASAPGAAPADKPPSQSVSLHYTFTGSDLALVLTESGFLHAYDVVHGEYLWSADAGGDMTMVTVDVPPSKDAILNDPLALPFVVRGNSLFTRTPFFASNPPASADASAELLDGVPPALRPYFFMNISTLLRRQTAFFGGTDVYVTTSVDVADLDVATGRPVGARAARARPVRGYRSSSGSGFTARPPASPSSSQKPGAGGVGDAVEGHNELFPLLHTVRYNVILHAVKAGEYSWSIRLSQLRLSPRAPAAAPRFAHASRRDGANSFTWSDGKTAHSDEVDENPRFFSQFMRKMFDYDGSHVVNVAYEQATRDAHAAEAQTREPSSSTPDASSMPPVPAWWATVQRSRTQAAKHVSEMVSLQQLNASHVALRSLYDGSTAWTAAMPHATRQATAFDASDGAGETGGGASSFSPTAPTVIASYVWISGADEVFRVPVVRSAAASVLEEDPDTGVYVERAPQDNVPVGADTRHRLPLLAGASTSGAVVVTPRDSADALQLVPFLQQIGVVPLRDHPHTGAGGRPSRGWLTDDVEADEREETELAEYYHQCSWWETPFLSWPSAATAAAKTPSLSYSSDAHFTNSNRDATAALLGFSSGPGGVVRTGLAWRTAAVISFHVVCLAGSIAFLCAGVPPRGQLQRAWAQADRNRDRLSHPSVSRPQSTQLAPQDLVLSPHGTSRIAPFSPILDSFSVDSPATAHISSSAATGACASFSVSPCSLSHPDDSLQDVLMQRRQRLAQRGVAPPHSPWTDPTPEQVYAMMREESEEKPLGVTGTALAATTASKTATTTAAATRTVPGSSTVVSPGKGAGLTPSVTPSAVEKSEERPREAGLVACLDNAAAAASLTVQEAKMTTSTESSSDDDSAEIDLGGEWWPRAQLPQQLPSAGTLDDNCSDSGSSIYRSLAQTATREEGKLFQNQFKVIKKIGFGGEGSVFCVEHRVTKAEYAMKVIQIHEPDEARVVQEAILHSSFDNVNVVRFNFCWIEDIDVSTADQLDLCNREEDGFDTASLTYSDASLAMSTSGRGCGGSVDTTTDTTSRNAYHMLFIQMEYFSRGTLADWLRRRAGFVRLEVLRYMRQIASGIEYLHNQEVVHRDLKPTNIFVSNANVLKIGDFGLAKRPGNPTADLASGVAGGQQEISIVGGSPLYCSPEQMRGDVVGKPSDIFSLGIIAVEMLCTFATLHERIRTLTDAHQGVLPPELESEFPDEAQLIRPMLAAQPQQRPVVHKLLRQIKRLVDTLEMEESDEEAEETAPHSVTDTAKTSAAHRGTSSGTSAAHHRSTRRVTAFATPPPPVAVATAAAATAPTASASPDPCDGICDGSPLHPPGESTPNPAPTQDGDDAVREAFLTPLQEQNPVAAQLPVWQETRKSPDRTAVAAPSSAVGAAAQRPRGLSRDGAADTVPLHGSFVVKGGNTYHTRENGSPNSDVNGDGLGHRFLSGSPPPGALYVSEPYGPQTMPVMYSGDADLTTVLKRDLQDRTTLAPD